MLAITIPSPLAEHSFQASSPLMAWMHHSIACTEKGSACRIGGTPPRVHLDDRYVPGLVRADAFDLSRRANSVIRLRSPVT